MKKGFSRYRADIGSTQEIGPGDVIRAITTATGVQDLLIGRIIIKESFTLIDLPADLSPMVFERLSGASIKDRPLQFELVQEGSSSSGRKGPLLPRTQRGTAASAGPRKKRTTAREKTGKPAEDEFSAKPKRRAPARGKPKGKTSRSK
ncbi:DbpA RNA binding domain-containing protein, partial [Myxococcota bacterium]|nr:DbpA RNA binding domain-containing protein [Myxococcota bacterium]